MDKIKIGVLGIGNMGSAIISGLLRVTEGDNIIAHDPEPERMAWLERHQGVVQANDLNEVLNFSQYLILAVKPDKIAEIMPSLCHYQGIIISIAAGITIESMERAIGSDKKIIRAMPNTPLLVGEGMTVIAVNQNVNTEEWRIALGIFASSGKAIRLEEELMDAVTGLSGSGPAYAYTFMQAMADGAVKMGLPREYALVLAAQTLYGAAEMVMKGGKNPIALRDKVCSPGGTTISAIHEMEKSGFSGIVMDAVERATLKSREMGGKR